MQELEHPNEIIYWEHDTKIAKVNIVSITQLPREDEVVVINETSYVVIGVTTDYNKCAINVELRSYFSKKL